MIVEQGLNCVLRFMLRESVFGMEIGLFTNSIVIDDDTVLADLDEATFPGYVRITAVSLTWPDPTINLDGESESDGPTMTWEASSAPGSPETIRGVFVRILDNTAAESLFLAYVFPDPVVITLIGDQVQKKINWFCDNY
jgi:hypothetical protein